MEVSKEKDHGRLSVKKNTEPKDQILASLSKTGSLT